MTDTSTDEEHNTLIRQVLYGMILAYTGMNVVENWARGKDGRGRVVDHE
jgi:hypothetical protein